ncbi:uncharacterized protein LOC132074724 [Ammospiza nelsoni]|uniref:uncharacterized protein LOC132074724 n=1 Tax=Ammospiza nelsoni TaxID=2857394 RepID=UPI00286BD24E|nr:uncharacterized protein LOC132074724 [Ammospiza nelsoni]XP_059330686.1 uncharacterized protein LOC132074724 [Ammospiza nelsoni]
MSPGWKGRDWSGWDTPGGCVGAPGGGTGNCCLSSLQTQRAALPGNGSCSWGVFGVSGGSVRAAAAPGPVQSSPWPRSRGQPLVRAHPSAARASQHPPRVCLARCPHGQDTEAQLLPGPHRGQEGPVPSRGSASSRPAFPAGRDTRRERRGTFPAGSSSARGLRAAPGLRSSAGLSPAVIRGCERSPAGNAPRQAGPALTLQESFGRGPREPSGLALLVSPWKGTQHQHLYSHQGNAEKDRKPGLWEEFCAVVSDASQFYPRAIPEAGVQSSVSRTCADFPRNSLAGSSHSHPRQDLSRDPEIGSGAWSRVLRRPGFQV